MKREQQWMIRTEKRIFEGKKIQSAPCISASATLSMTSINSASEGPGASKMSPVFWTEPGNGGAGFAEVAQNSCLSFASMLFSSFVEIFQLWPKLTYVWGHFIYSAVQNNGNEKPSKEIKVAIIACCKMRGHRPTIHREWLWPAK